MHLKSVTVAVLLKAVLWLRVLEMGSSPLVAKSDLEDPVLNRQQRRWSALINGLN